MGSKKKLLSFIEEVIEKETTIKDKVVCDLFSGTGAVAEFFKDKGAKEIITNDLQYYSYIRTVALLANEEELKFKYFIDKYNINPKNRFEEIEKLINDLKPKKGFITKNYSPESINHCEYERSYFTIENSMRIDTVKEYLYSIKDELKHKEFCYLVASLVESADRVANHTGVYTAYLKKFQKTALKPFKYKLLEVNKKNSLHKAFNNDCNKVIKNIQPDILYLDPPYNTRQYASDYHILETIATNYNGELTGKTGRPDWSNKRSSFSSKREVKEAFKTLIKSNQAKNVFLSYNDEGILSHTEIIDIFNSNNYQVELHKQEYKRYKSNNHKQKRDKVYEYLFSAKKIVS
ncbi:DNA adenine methylase [Brassicibacter mesophilus]|uniref:DNA adenine methylase n=1 Tax=Brassicibacter mesophilus TaxID=745119 RepID=UPI003D23F822